MRKWIVIGVLSSLRMCAQSGALQDFRFQHLTTDDGLSDNAVTCVYEDMSGYIWIGTENGLNKYDGSTVQRIAGTETSIAAVIEDRSGVLWIATKDRGLMRLDRITGELRHFNRSDTSADAMASEKLTALYDLDDTTMLIGSREATLMFLDKRTFRFSYWTDSTSISPSRAKRHTTNTAGWCHAIVQLDEQRLWIGLLNMYLSFIIDRRTGSITQYAAIDRAGSETQTSMVLRNGILYSGGWQNGIDVVALRDLPCKLSRKPCNTRVIATDEEVTALMPWHNSELLAGVRQRGLYRIEANSGATVRIAHDRSDPASIASDRVRCMLIDRKGTLWVGTASGLDYHVPPSWNFIAQDVFGDARTNAPDVFFHRLEGAPGGGVRIFSSEGFFVQDSANAALRNEPFEHDGRSLQPTVMATDHHGDRLVGTEYGIARMPVNGRSPAAGIEPSMEGTSHALGGMYQVRGIMADTLKGRPVFVIATLGFGVQVVDANSQQVLGAAMPQISTQQNTLSLVNSMARDRNGCYWFGSAGGLYSWKSDQPLSRPGTGETGNVAMGRVIAAGEDVRQVLLVHDTLWGVTKGGLLLRVANDRSHMFRPPVWIRSAMYGIAADDHGRLWITTDNGLLRFDPIDSSFIRVPVNDGARFRKLTGAITALDDGRIAFCADNTLLTFRPEAFDRLPILPNAYITKASTAGKPLWMHDGEVELSYRSSVIDIGVSALALGFPRPLAFEYKLDGVESEWRTLNAHDAIRYAGVPAGDHRLLVKVMDAFGRSGPEQVLLVVSVNAPFWLQWWFYALLLFVIAAALWFFYRFRLKQQVRLQRVRDRIARDLHDDIGSTLGSISYYGEAVKQRMEQNDPAGAKEVLERIGESSREMIDQMHDIVWSVDPRKDAFGELSLRMRSFASEMLGPQDIGVLLEEDPTLGQVKLNMEQRKGLFLIFKEAVYNVAKHSGARNLRITLRKQGRDLVITISDDGHGMANGNGTSRGGNGLENMRRRAADLGGECVISPADGSGTEVRVRVPLHSIVPTNGD